MKYNYWHGFTKWRVDWVHLRNDTTGWLNTLLSFKPKKICAPVRPCTSVQDESPLPSPSSSGFCQQFLKNPRSWFHTGVDSRFRMHSDIPKKQQGCQPWTIIIIIFVLIFFLTTIVPPGEEDEGAHPHDGLELADGKGFIAVRETRYQKLPLKHLWLRLHNTSVL